jgi:hypothetical protein
MTLKKLIKRGLRGSLFGVAPPCVVLLAVLCFPFFAPNSTGMSAALAAGEGSTPVGVSQKATDTAAPSGRTMEQRIEEMERALNKTEERSFENKMMARELIRYVKLVVAVLVIIALVFPLTIWLMSRKRILGLSSLSPELATTLLVVEERQAKLANILKEIQGEIDYLHTMSVPDLKNLIQQAESYLKQNEADLDDAGRSSNKAETTKK